MGKTLGEVAYLAWADRMGAAKDYASMDKNSKMAWENAAGRVSDKIAGKVLEMSSESLRLAINMELDKP